MSLFRNKTLLITGGTGSFGNAVLNRFLATDIKEIRIFSRDELKQDDMRHFISETFQMSVIRSNFILVMFVIWEALEMLCMV